MRFFYINSYLYVFIFLGGYIMIVSTAKLVIDLGNSETRVKTLYGKTARGNTRSKLTRLDNRYSIIPEEKISNYLENSDYTDENSVIFKVDNGLCYCSGDLCNIEFAQTSFRPSALEKKYSSTVTKLSIINAIRQGIEDVSLFSNCDVESIDVDWEISVLLPPEDLDLGARQLADVVKSITSVDFIMPCVKKNVRIKKVSIFPEGMCAFFGVLFERKGVVREGYKYLIENNESTVIFDIGAGTTDIVLVKGSQVVQSSRFTKEVGGNNIHRLVQRSLRNKGIPLPDEVVREGVNTGYVRSGSRVVDISEDIAGAKRAVSNQLVDAVQEFFESSMISIRTIANILVCGGGAEESENDKITPISNYITEYMKRLSPDLKLIEMPEVNINGEIKKMSPRLLNITGAGILAE